MFKNLTIKKVISLGAFIAAVVLAFINPSATTIIGMFLGSAMGVVSFKEVFSKNNNEDN